MVLHPIAWLGSVRLPFVVAGMAVLGGCTTLSAGGGHEMLNAVLWQQGAEYRALALQTYATALARLDEALATPSWTAALEQRGDPSALPPAVVLDLDETVLDNTPYEAQIILHLGQYSSGSFRRWCEEGQPAAVPGAVEFVRAARARGVTVFYYSARVESLRECTLRSLRVLGVAPASSDFLMLRDPNGPGGKSAFRRRIADSHRILLLIGDNLEDFIDGSKADADTRRRLVERHRPWVGRRWIVLPNPMYGHWEALHYDFDYRLDRGEKLERKRRALSP